MTVVEKLVVLLTKLEFFILKMNEVMDEEFQEVSVILKMDVSNFAFRVPFPNGFFSWVLKGRK